MGNIYEEALKKHEEWKGKIETHIKFEIKDADDLSLAYTPGVAEPCRKINEDVENAYKYTWKGNIVAVISDGTAVLGLGDIGPEASLPVMEGKCVLFKKFGGVNAVPVVLNTKDTEEIISTIKTIAPTYGGINLEDISSPRCVEIERRLIEELDIPVFHDDQHGTAIVVTAALINAFKLLKKDPKESVAVVSGAGAAGHSIIRMMKELGVGNIYAFDSKGVLSSKNKDSYNFVKKEILEITNNDDEDLTIAEAMAKSDIFIGVSTAGVIDADMVKSMKDDSIVLAMANPEPEIDYYVAKKSGAKVAGTGRSDFPNQINNVLVFPGLFKGALKVRAKKISEEMKMAAAQGLASTIAESELNEEYIIPSIFNKDVEDAVANAVAEKAVEQGLNK
ncbi:NAD(P)-dependent malic enzyme [Anaerosphaera multitolerans]|uniref:NADP-dependent malic enzyme n=1 Tax=Anaerosphaera multitolerans TaxID=2487351 RepID=A0A437S4Z4_9FIRM|nr:NADP-dependent malic enzyme [Anaerosphaera multitolerans]RVU54047.1 NADP-dependent malic enzyme [Anaerosphaera multitolerans]